MSPSIAKEESTTSLPQQAFDLKINKWAEGTVASIAPDGAKLTLRGSRRPYAAKYARMLKRIHEKTLDTPVAEHEKLGLEIRKKWKGILRRANLLETPADRNITIYLPGPERKLILQNETQFYNRERKAVATDLVVERPAYEMKDLKVGDLVVIGYEKGTTRNHAYVIMKINRRVVKQ